MKRALKVLGGLLLFVVLLVGLFVVYVEVTWDKDYSQIAKPDIQASQDPEIVKRGEYVAHSVAHCSICHVPRAVTEKRQPGERPAMTGGFEWKMGPMGTLYSRNITPDPETGIGNWTDAELARAIRWGVGRDGKGLTFMAMAVPALGDEDLKAVVSYLRSTTPVRQQNRAHDLGFVMKWFAGKFGPDFRHQFQDRLKYVAAGAEPSVGRGEYLALGAAACFGCHSPFDLMSGKLTGPELSGSSEGEPDPDDPTMVFRTPNLTPDPTTGHLNGWDEERFVSRFRAGRAVKSSKMPWEAFREMTDADLRSLFRYLRSLPPSKHYIGSPWRKATDDPAKDPPQR